MPQSNHYLSILIPTYNDMCVHLVASLVEQASQIDGLSYEILVADDGSTSKETIVANQDINTYPHCKYLLREQNIGRSAIRNFLARQAQYDLLLFIDSHMSIVNDDYLSHYLTYHDRQLTYGGYTIKKDPNHQGNLRYARDITHGSPWKLMLYDLDVAFFHISYCVNNVTTFGNQVSTVNMKMLTSPVYRGKYLTRSAEAYRGVLSEEHICAEIDRLAAQVAPEVARDATVTGMNEASWIAHLDSLKAQLRDGWITANMNELFSQLSVIYMAWHSGRNVLLP